MGGQVRAIFCGSAPLEPNVLRFVRCATGAYVLEGYGQTECAAVCACQLPGETVSGQVGPPLPSNMVHGVLVRLIRFYKYFRTEINVSTVDIFHNSERSNLLDTPFLVLYGYALSQIKLVDVPEMEISAKDGKGEICIKGPNVFKGSFLFLSTKKSIYIKNIPTINHQTTRYTFRSSWALFYN